MNACLLTCTKQLNLEDCKLNCKRKVKLFSHYAIKNSLQVNIHGFVALKHTIHSANWSKTTISKILQFTVKYITYISILGYFSLVIKALLDCPLSILERCPSYREYSSYSTKFEKW